ncbi:MAG: PAS domain S-box protein [Acidobacteria bacterium]|nr:PAS domain S-box protein [Acidobacteriota bacterium]
MKSSAEKIYSLLERISDDNLKSELLQAYLDLAKYERKYHLLESISSDIIWELNKDGVITYVSTNTDAIVGYTPEELIGKTIFEFMEPEESSKMMEIFRQIALASGSIMDLESKVIHKNGDKVTLLVTGVPLINEYGEIQGFWGLNRDISRRLLAEQAYEEREAQLQSIFRSAPVGIGVISNRIMQWANKHVLDMSGYTLDEMIGKSTKIFYVSEDEYLRAGKELYQQIQKNGIGSVETQFRKKNGDVIYVIMSASPIDPSETYQNVTFSILDITEMKQAREELRRSELKYRNLIETSPFAITLMNLEGKIVFTNKKLSQMLGYDKPEELINIFALNLIAPDERKRIEETFREVIDSDSVYSGEFKLLKKNGKEIISHLTVNLIRDDKGRPETILSIAQDITEKKIIEGELIRFEKLESLGVLAGGIAHDFNNILAALLGNIDLARLYIDNRSKLEENLQEAERAISQATSLTHQLLTFSKGGSPIKEATDIVDIIKETSKFILRGSSVVCSILPGEDIPPVDVDRGQISQVFNNIILNAEQAMDKQGVITITIENCDKLPEKFLMPPNNHNWIKISIIDQGKGISKGDQEKIFDPFYTTKKTGSGLGLASTHTIIKNHNGFIDVESEPGEGATFHIYLPSSGGKVKHSEKNDLIQPLFRKKILLMDDEEMVRNTAFGLLRYLGYHVDICSNGDDAIKMYHEALKKEEAYHIVILDLTVPGGMGGKETMEKILSIHPEAIGIATSGYSNDPVMSHYRKYGFKNVISKPYNLEQLNKLLNETILSIAG